MTLRARANTGSSSSSGSGSDSSGSSGSSSSSGSGSSSSDSDSSASDSPEPRRDAAAARPAPAPPPPPRPPRPPSEQRRPTRPRTPGSPGPKRSPRPSGSPAPRPGPAEAPRPRPAEAPPCEDARGARPKDPKDAPSAVPPKPRPGPGRPGRPPSKPPPGRPPNGRRDERAARRPAKKKSIFSPDNSSESEPETNDRGRRPEPKGSPAPDRPKEEDGRRKGAVPKRPPDRRGGKSVPKETVSSRTTTDTGSAASGSDGDAAARAPTSPDRRKRTPAAAPKPNRTKAAKTEPERTDAARPARPPAVRRDPTPPGQEGAARPGTDSDAENAKPPADAANATRKSTRSSSARKSRHVIGKSANSDTESETDAGPSKRCVSNAIFKARRSSAAAALRSVSKSPVKRATVPGKGPSAPCPVRSRGGAVSGPPAGQGPGAVPRGSQAADPSSPRSNVPEKEQELRCSVPGCDSLGHLSGRLDRHFTVEGCPIYHNTTAKECREQAMITLAAQDTRRKAQHLLKARKTSQPSLEHRAYQLKVKELRSKWKPTEVKQEKEDSGSKSNWSAQEAERCGEREPVLLGFVPDYDLSLFREAQAAAAYKIEEELKNMPSNKGTRYVCMGKYRMEAWYQSPYPPDAARLPQLYLCEFCLNHHTTVTGITRHRAKCQWRHPPGDEVYRKGKLGVWQVDGRRHKQYCQQLCLLAKFFLDHKTLYYDVEPFLFYVMTLADSEGCHTVGYFSKEKNSLLNYNVSCILTLPPYQRQGYGRLLIDFSYLLTKVEGKIGSPEKPLSDLGLISYRSYWKDVLLQYLCDHHGPTLSIKDLSQMLAINSYDIVSTLQALGMMKYWKGKHIILKKQDVLDEYRERTKKRGQVKQIDPECLKWKPFVPPQAQGGG